MKDEAQRNTVCLMIEVDLDDFNDWGVGVVPGSDDELPPHNVISTILAYVAREHNLMFNQADDIPDDDDDDDERGTQ